MQSWYHSYIPVGNYVTLVKPSIMSPTAIVFGSVLIIALIIFIAMRNQKDKKDLVNKLNNDYRKTKNEENDTDIEEQRK